MISLWIFVYLFSTQIAWLSLKNPDSSRWANIKRQRRRRPVATGSEFALNVLDLILLYSWVLRSAGCPPRNKTRPPCSMPFGIEFCSYLQRRML